MGTFKEQPKQLLYAYTVNEVNEVYSNPNHLVICHGNFCVLEKQQHAFLSFKMN